MYPGTKSLPATDEEHSTFLKLGVSCWALIGSLNYLSVPPRPNIAFAVSVLSRHLEKPGIAHYNGAIQVFRYLIKTKHTGIQFLRKSSCVFSIFVDSDWGNCPSTRRSQTGLVALMGTNIISWKSSRQQTVSLSSTEAKYKALSDAAKEAIWLRSLQNEVFGGQAPSATIINVDNKGAIDLALCLNQPKQLSE